MRKILSVLAVLCLLVVFVHAQTGAPMSGKTASSWKCAPPNPVHVEKEGAATEFLDGTATAGKGYGIFIETLANGDKLHVSYEFTGTVSNKVFQSGSNKWP